jgi:hypothetical protein
MIKRHLIVTRMKGGDIGPKLLDAKRRNRRAFARAVAESTFISKFAIGE